MNTILFIAPYSSISSDNPALGAAKKISLFVHSITSNSFKVVFLNTANNVKKKRGFDFEFDFPQAECFLVKSVTVAPRWVGRFLWILGAPVVGLYQLIKHRPTHIWVYNQGSAELIIAIVAGICGVKIINEVEDLPNARKREFGNLKPRIDNFFAAVLSRRVDRYICVSKTVADAIGNETKTKFIVNGLINSVRVKHSEDGFDTANQRVGYFGGLSSEKGADLLCQLLKETSRAPFTICGTGPLLSEIASLIRKDFGDRLLFKITDTEVEAAMAECSILINPHTETEHLVNSVFPFKLVEYINTNAWVISTQTGFDETWGANLGLILCKKETSSFMDIIKEKSSSNISLEMIQARVNFLSNFQVDNVVKKVLELSLNE